MWKRIAVLAFVTVWLCACQNRQEHEAQNFQNNLQTYFAAHMLDSTEKLDSFAFSYLDSFTQFQHVNMFVSVYEADQRRLSELYQLNTEQVSMIRDQIRSNGALENHELTDTKRRYLEKLQQRGQVLRAELDTVTKIYYQFLDELKTADTVKAMAYQAHCLYRVHSKDMAVKRGATFILLNTNKDIVNREEFLKLPYVVDFKKFD